MRAFTVPVEISELRGRSFVRLDALVDTGAVTSVAPTSLLQGLGVTPSARRTFLYADGREADLDMAEVVMRVDGRETVTWVAFGSDDVIALLGSYTLEGVFMKVDPYSQRLEPVGPALL